MHVQPTFVPSETVTEKVRALPQQSVKLNETSTVEGKSVSIGQLQKSGQSSVQQQFVRSRLLT